MDGQTFQAFLSGFLGFVGGLLTIPINALFSYILKRDELAYSHKLDQIAERRKLLLEHQLEMRRKGKETETSILLQRLNELENRLKS